MSCVEKNPDKRPSAKSIIIKLKSILQEDSTIIPKDPAGQIQKLNYVGDTEPPNMSLVQTTASNIPLQTTMGIGMPNSWHAPVQQTTAQQFIHFPVSSSAPSFPVRHLDPSPKDNEKDTKNNDS